MRLANAALPPTSRAQASGEEHAQAWLAAERETLGGHESGAQREEGLP